MLRAGWSFFFFFYPPLPFPFPITPEFCYQESEQWWTHVSFTQDDEPANKIAVFALLPKKKKKIPISIFFLVVHLEFKEYKKATKKNLLNQSSLTQIPHFDPYKPQHSKWPHIVREAGALCAYRLDQNSRTIKKGEREREKRKEKRPFLVNIRCLKDAKDIQSILL